MSHSFAAERHTNVDGWKASGGHVLLLPVHVSATSHPPIAAPRHVAPELPGACWQMLLAPLQRSVVQTLPSSVHAVPLVLNVHVVVQHDPAMPLFAAPSSHCSPGLRVPFPQLAACSWPASTVRRPTKAKARMRGIESFVRVARRAAGCSSRVVARLAFNMRPPPAQFPAFAGGNARAGAGANALPLEVGKKRANCCAQSERIGRPKCNSLRCCGWRVTSRTADAVC